MTSKSFKVSCTLRSLKDTSVFTLLPRCVVPIIVHIRDFCVDVIHAHALPCDAFK